MTRRFDEADDSVLISVAHARVGNQKTGPNLGYASRAEKRKLFPRHNLQKRQ